MHTGRSHHTATEIVGSAIGGFALSFLILSSQVILQSSKNFQAQLLAGDTTTHPDLPSAINAMRSVGQGTDPIMRAMTSYAWWIVVIVGAVIASFALLKIMRKYV